MSALDILAEDSQKKFLERLDKILKGQKVPSSVEFKIRAKSGREFYVLINSKIIYGDDGKPKGATAVVHDITEQKQAEEEKEKPGISTSAGPEDGGHRDTGRRNRARL